MMMESLFQLIVLIFGTCIGGLVLWKLFGLVRSSINGKTNSITDEDFNRLAKAFIQHKKEMHERVQNLEAIADEEDNGEKQIYPEIEEHREEEILTNNLRNKERSQ